MKTVIHVQASQSSQTMGMHGTIPRLDCHLRYLKLNRKG